MEYRIVISRRDTVDAPLAEVQNEANGLKWEYNRIGGCGAFSFSVAKRLFKDTNLELDSNVKIYLKESGTYVLRFQGKIQSKNYSIRGEDETINVQGFGYQVELNNIYVNQNYSSTETSLVAVDILNDDVVPNTNITFLSSTGIDATSFTPNSLEFNTTAINCFQTLAEIAGTREWGVDENRRFYFKTRSSSVGFQLPIGSVLESLTYDVSSKDVVNRVIIIGGDVAGVPYTRTVNDTTSQVKWKRRDSVIQNSAIVTDAVADQFGASMLEEFKNVSRRVMFNEISNRIWEDDIPMPLIQLKTDVDKYGTKKYGEGLYNDIVNLRINRVSYSIDENGVMSSSLDLGLLRPDAAENIAQLKYQIEQLQSVGV